MEPSLFVESIILNKPLLGLEMVWVCEVFQNKLTTYLETPQRFWHPAWRGESDSDTFQSKVSLFLSSLLAGVPQIPRKSWQDTWGPSVHGQFPCRHRKLFEELYSQLWAGFYPSLRDATWSSEWWLPKGFLCIQCLPPTQPKPIGLPTRQVSCKVGTNLAYRTWKQFTWV